MTIPSERSYAVLETRKFLLALSNKEIKKIPTAVREQARRLLRHYPGDFYINEAAEKSPEVFGKVDYELPEV